MGRDVADSADRPADDKTKEGPEVEITDEMIEAGLHAFYAWSSMVEEPDGLVLSILEAALDPRFVRRQN